MKVTAIDAFYLSMPEVLDIGDGSQDMLLIRARAGEHTGWGECEASPLTSIASLVCPMSHSACQPVLASVLGQDLNGPADIGRIVREVRARSLDLLQADHTLSGIEIALWDLLGKARNLREQGFRAVKFGWGPFGQSTVAADADQVHAAREGLGTDIALLVDAGTVWGEDVEAAALRLPSLEQAGVLWLEEPFVSGALRAYQALARRGGTVKLAAGEGAHNAQLAEHLIDYGGIGFVQVDTGRIGGIGDAFRVAGYARERDVRFVNHTFTSHLALSASLQPFAGSAADWLCEYPMEAKALAVALTSNRITIDANGQVCAPPLPGLGMTLDLDAVRPYLLDVEVGVGGRTLYRTPDLVP